MRKLKLLALVALALLGGGNAQGQTRYSNPGAVKPGYYYLVAGWNNGTYAVGVDVNDNYKLVYKQFNANDLSFIFYITSTTLGAEEYTGDKTIGELGNQIKAYWGNPAWSAGSRTWAIPNANANNGNEMFVTTSVGSATYGDQVENKDYSSKGFPSVTGFRYRLGNNKDFTPKGEADIEAGDIMTTWNDRTGVGNLYYQLQPVDEELITALKAQEDPNIAADAAARELATITINADGNGKVEAENGIFNNPWSIGGIPTIENGKTDPAGNKVTSVAWDNASYRGITATYYVNVPAGKAGTYNVLIMHGSNYDWRHLTFQVNGYIMQSVKPTTVATGWNQVGTMVFQTKLKEGENEITIGGHDRYFPGVVTQTRGNYQPASFDYIQFTKAESEIELEAGYKSADIEAGSGTLANGAGKETRNFKYKNGLGFDNAGTATYTINVPSAGVYMFDFIYAEAAERNFAIKVNNKPYITVEAQNMGSWNDATASRKVFVEMTAGDNTVILYGNGNVSPIIDYFTVTKVQPEGWSYQSLPSAAYVALQQEIAKAQDAYDHRGNENGVTDFLAAIAAATDALDAAADDTSLEAALTALQEAEETFADEQAKGTIKDGSVVEAESGRYEAGSGFGTGAGTDAEGGNDVTTLTLDNTARTYHSPFATYTLNVAAEDAGAYKLTAKHGCFNADRYIAIQVNDGALQLGITGGAGNNRAGDWNQCDGELVFYVNLNAGENTLKVRSTAQDQAILVTAKDQQLNFADPAFSPVLDKFIFEKITEEVTIPAGEFQHLEAETAMPTKSAKRSESEFSGGYGIGLDWGASDQFTVTVNEGGYYLMDVVSYNGGWGTNRPVHITVNKKPTFSLMENSGAGMVRRAVVVELQKGENTIALVGGDPTTPAPIIDFFEFTRVIAQGSTLSVLPNEYKVNVTAAGYATFYIDEATTIPEGVTAYTGKVNAETGNLTLTPVEGVLPANTAVVLEATEGTYAFDGTADAAAITDNDLQGTLEAISTPSGALTLQVIDDQIGFYTFTGETIPANKAYLVLGSEVKGLSLSFGETDGVTSIATELPEGENIYNLAGQRVSKATKGIYIINGRKVVVK